VDINPKNYELVFEPDLTKFTFEGKEKINIYCKKATKTISLNCSEIKIKSCNIESNKKTISSSFKTSEKSEELKILVVGNKNIIKKQLDGLNKGEIIELNNNGQKIN